MGMGTGDGNIIYASQYIVSFPDPTRAHTEKRSPQCDAALLLSGQLQ